MDHASGRRLRNHHSVVEWGCKSALRLTGKRCLLTVPAQYILLTLLENRRFYKNSGLGNHSVLGLVNTKKKKEEEE